MDGRSFDRIARIFSSAVSRRGALRGLLAASLFGAVPGVTDAKKRKNAGKGRGGKKGREKSGGEGGGKSRHWNRRQVQSQALARGCCSSGNCTPGAGKNLQKCCYEDQTLSGRNFKGANLGNANFSGATLTNANLVGANLGQACLVGADLTGAKLGGANMSTAIFCGTTMPDGSTNNTGCNTSTSCCPMCAGDCPPDQSNNEPGFCCASGFCSCGGDCCSSPDCWIFTTSSNSNGENPVVRTEELCEPPDGCVFCQGREDQCCTACIGPNEECASSGPIAGGSIRRR